MENENMKKINTEDYLMHFGVQGQKWGKRRYQNPDGSLTPAGRAHYGVGVGQWPGTKSVNKYVDKEGVLNGANPTKRQVRQAIFDNERRYQNAKYHRDLAQRSYEKHNRKGRTNDADMAAKTVKAMEKEMKAAESSTWKNIAKAIENKYNVDVTKNASTIPIKTVKKGDMAARMLLGIPLQLITGTGGWAESTRYTIKENKDPNSKLGKLTIR